MNKEQLIADIKAMTVLELSELVKALEEEFGMEIPEVEAEKIVSVGDVVDYIKSVM